MGLVDKECKLAWVTVAHALIPAFGKQVVLCEASRPAWSTEKTCLEKLKGKKKDFKSTALNASKS